MGVMNGRRPAIAKTARTRLARFMGGIYGFGGRQGCKGGLPLSVIDTHLHLTFPDFAGRLPEVIAAAARAGVHGMITISTTTKDCLDALAIAKGHANVWCTAGVHPLYSDEGPHEWENLGRCIREPKCVAWGELGLDNHYPEPARDLQRRVLDEQLAYIASVRDVSKPIVVHCREAFDDLIPVLKVSGLDTSRMVFHCFTGGPDDVRKVLDIGAYVGFTGVLTYRNAKDVQAAAELVPMDRLLVETDAPFLSPEPKRGTKPCEPWMCSLTAGFLANLRRVSVAELEVRLNENTERLFGIRAEVSA